MASREISLWIDERWYNKTAALMNTQSPVGVLSQMHEEENTTKQSPGSRYRESSIGLKKKRSLPNREELRETGWSDRGDYPLKPQRKKACA